tara:strand:- start:11742 stop:12674 length:933 start_codon:yes stop_codon:yes gene_type:complete
MSDQPPVEAPSAAPSIALETPSQEPAAPVAQAAQTPATAPVAQSPAPIEAAPAPVMPNDWRNQMAGEDEKTLKLLERYKTPGDAANALREAQQKIREGVADKLPENATDEQLAVYREQNGIPADASGYEITLSDGLVIGADDKPMVDTVLAAMHGANAPPESVNAAVNAYYTMQEQAYNDREVKDNADQSSTVAALKESWGNDYQANQNAVASLLNTVPEAVREELQSARMPNGDAIFNSPEVMEWMASVSRKTNPAATVMPNSNNPIKGMNDEIQHIEKLMKTNNAEYWGDSKMQDRYRELLGAQEASR